MDRLARHVLPFDHRVRGRVGDGERGGGARIALGRTDVPEALPAPRVPGFDRQAHEHDNPVVVKVFVIGSAGLVKFDVAGIGIGVKRDGDAAGVTHRGRALRSNRLADQQQQRAESHERRVPVDLDAVAQLVRPGRGRGVSVPVGPLLGGERVRPVAGQVSLPASLDFLQCRSRVNRLSPRPDDRTAPPRRDRHTADRAASV